MGLSWRSRPVVLGVACAAAIGGALAAVHYHRLGLTLTHYDARGHLVVARRILDSITPGWQQIGAVWLPLPHLLNAIPVQFDAMYRTGASAVAISIVAFAIAAGSIASIVSALTGSWAAAIAGACVFAFNPNVVYLQATPMTEPLLLALTTLGVALLVADLQRVEGRALDRLEPVRCEDRHTVDPRSATALAGRSAIGLVFVLACLTRYEAWPVTFAALAAAVWARWRKGDSFAVACRAVGALAAYPIAAIAAFAIFSRVVIGEWFVAGGFFVPENKALHDPRAAVDEIAWGVKMLSGTWLVTLGGAGVAVLIAAGLFSRKRADALVAASLAAAAVLPWSAFVDGHPFRIRYMVPLIAIEAVGAGVIAGMTARVLAGVTGDALARRIARVSWIPAALLAGIVVFELRPLDASAPMVVEAQWDRPNLAVREQVTSCLGRPMPGMKIMASMGSLGHYMQEASSAGFSIRDFLHEGNGDIWLAALDRPYPFADWILIEEKAEGGDMLAKLTRATPSLLAGYTRVCEGAGLALYKRNVERETPSQ